jgi:3',5'-cyclic AMP phosphodiesterase CpdA
MFVLAQLSDLHMALPPQPAQLLGKRGLGFINWQRKRRFIHRPEVLDAVTADVRNLGADHIAVTGDLVNLSLPHEYARARTWLDALGPSHDVTVVPGNHDAYVPIAAQMPAEYWADYMRGDDGLQRFPFLRRRGGARLNVALIALSTGVPTGPFMATGRLGARQLADLAAMLDQTRGAFRIVLIHHPPVTPLKRYLRRLIDAADFRRVLAEHGAELVLHGHDHRHSLLWLAGKEKNIPAIGVPSASANAPHGHEDGAGYNVFQIDAAGGNWRCDMVARQRGAGGTITDAKRISLFPSS